jgi:hypothetical protein
LQGTWSPRIIGGMKLRFVGVLLLACLFLGCSSSKPPSGPDPLSGTWSGHWGPTPERQTEVALALQWDGTTLKGTVNPDARAIELTKAAFDPQTKAVTMALDIPIAGGGMDHYAIDGKVDGKSMKGTWTRNDGKGDFTLTKN